MIKIGTSGFQYEDWKGIVYPAEIRDKDILPYYNKVLGFDTVEISASFSKIPSPKTVQDWLEKTAYDFMFTIKCHRQITGSENRNFPLKALKNNKILSSFQESFRPIAEEGKLFAYLAMFGPYFIKNDANKQYLQSFRELLKDERLIIEFRHQSWLGEGEREDTLWFLADNGLGIAVIDQAMAERYDPVIFKGLEAVYLRFAGRSKKWFMISGASRYDYFYADEELKESVPFIKTLKNTAVYFSNTNYGGALHNSRTLKHLLLS